MIGEPRDRFESLASDLRALKIVREHREQVESLATDFEAEGATGEQGE